MANFNEEDIEETSPISSQDALLAIEKVNLLFAIIILLS